MALQAAVRHKDFGGIETRDELDHAVMLVGVFDLQIDRINHDMELAIKAAKTEAMEKAGGIQSKRAEWLAKIYAYLVGHKGDIVVGNTKSAKLNFGKVGFRKATDKIGLPKKGTEEMEELVRRIASFAAGEADPWGKIITHTDNYVLKSDLKELESEHLTALMLSFTEGEDAPFVEPNREKIVTLPENKLEAAS
jgi:hypothetical protein